MPAVCHTTLLRALPPAVDPVRPAAPLTEREAPATDRGAPATARLMLEDANGLHGEGAEAIRSYHGEEKRDEPETLLTGRSEKTTARNKAKKLLFTKQKPKPKPKQLCKSSELGRAAPLGSDVVLVQGQPAVQIQTTLSPFLMGDWEAIHTPARRPFLRQHPPI